MYKYFKATNILNVITTDATCGKCGKWLIAEIHWAKNYQLNENFFVETLHIAAFYIFLL